jgi:hypothetical protein
MSKGCICNFTYVNNFSWRERENDLPLIDIHSD